MQRLGTNAIRVYNLDPDLDHTECSSIFNVRIRDLPLHRDDFADFDRPQVSI